MANEQPGENTIVGIIEARTQPKVYRWELDQGAMMLLWGLWTLLPGNQMEWAAKLPVPGEWLWGAAMALIGFSRIYAAAKLSLAWRARTALLGGVAWSMLAALAVSTSPNALRVPMLGWLSVTSFRSYMAIMAKARR